MNIETRKIIGAQNRRKTIFEIFGNRAPGIHEPYELKVFILERNGSIRKVELKQNGKEN